MRDSEFEHAHPNPWKDERKDTFEPSDGYILSTVRFVHWPLRPYARFGSPVGLQELHYERVL